MKCSQTYDIIVHSGARFASKVAQRKVELAAWTHYVVHDSKPEPHDEPVSPRNSFSKTSESERPSKSENDPECRREKFEFDDGTNSNCLALNPTTEHVTRTPNTTLAAQKSHTWKRLQNSIRALNLFAFKANSEEECTLNSMKTNYLKSKSSSEYLSNTVLSASSTDQNDCLSPLEQNVVVTKRNRDNKHSKKHNKRSITRGKNVPNNKTGIKSGRTLVDDHDRTSEKSNLEDKLDDIVPALILNKKYVANESTLIGISIDPELQDEPIENITTSNNENESDAYFEVICYL